VRPRGLALLSLLAVGLAACGAVPNLLATPVPPDALHPRAALEPAPPTAVAPADPATLNELGAHRAAWTATGIDDYTMTVIFGCECGLAGRPIDITVKGGQLVSAHESGAALDPAILTGFPATVDALFAYGDRFANAGKIEFAWDRRFDFPTAIGVDPDLDARDDEVRIAVTAFSPLP
jgi:hypothetical protein